MGSNRARSIRGPLVGITFFIFLLFVAEGLGSVLLGPPTRLDRIHAMLRQDRTLFWRQRSNLSVEFEGARVTTNALGLRDRHFAQGRRDNSVRVICLGASPTFGWGVGQQETYAKDLERRLQSGLGSNRVEVINAGQIGYSSYQGVRYFQDVILPLRPDIITLSYVINDVDKYRFYQNNLVADSTLQHLPEFLVRVENILSHSRFYRFYRRVLNQTRSVSHQFFGRSGVEEFREGRRVSLEEYRANISAIVRLAKEQGIGVVLMKMPVNLPAAAVVSTADRARAAAVIGQARAKAADNNFAEAIALLRQALITDASSARAYFYLGKYHEKLGRREEAASYFEKMVLMELYECAALAKEYHRALEDVSAAEGVVLVDLVSAFAEYEREKEDYLFLDPQHDTIHPNARGHRVIAETLYGSLRKMIGPRQL